MAVLRVNDAIAGMAIIIFAALIFSEAATYRPAVGATFGPGFFPKIIVALLAVCGVILTLRGWRGRRVTAWIVRAEWMRDPKAAINLMLVIVAPILTVIFVKDIGFPLAGFAIVSILAWRMEQSFVGSVIFGALLSIVAYQLFAGLLRVPLPQGPVPLPLL